MRLSSIFTIAGTFVLAGLLSLVAAYFTVRLVEDASEIAVRNALDGEGLTWADADTNGLQVFLIGTAPDEALRFRAVSIAGGEVDAARVIDQMLVEEAEDIAPPRFSLEILRNDSGISVIGLVPVTTDREALIAQFTEIAGGAEVADLLETADFPQPKGWNKALRYATRTLRDLPQSKISVEAGRVAVKAMTESEEARRRIEATLARQAPDGLRLALELSAPRPVISPFTLRFLIDDNGVRFDACSADSEASRDRILRAAAQAGLEGKATCRIGLGTPSRRWVDAVEISMAKLAELGAGSLTISNADIAILAPEGTSQALFDRVIGELETALPPVFALQAVLQQPEVVTDAGPPEFVATRSPEGNVQLRGRLNSEITRQTADSYARARFGSDTVYTAARVDQNLPQGWATRALAGLEALAMLENGAVTVTPNSVTVTGKTGNSQANVEIAQLLTTKLGEASDFDIQVTYEEKLDRSLGIPSPEDCVAGIVAIIGERKITFEPGSATLDLSAKDILDEVAELLKICGDIPLEIGGHTDSQGREVMNKELSQDRAQAVADALRDRRVLTASYTITGYGEDNPIADNTTEEGREANRRIEFKLVVAEPIPEEPTTLDAVADQQQEGETAPAEEAGDE
ncbi:MAG: OmpA family protein [Paracoccaceae bacterium]|nr:OmpA family protein [Paracoccaceae bacterium]